MKTQETQCNKASLGLPGGKKLRKGKVKEGGKKKGEVKIKQSGQRLA